MMKFDTIEEAARAWVKEFNAIPSGIIEKIIEHYPEDLLEVTPPAVNDHVYIFAGDYRHEYGEIVATKQGEDEDQTLIRLDSDRSEVLVDNEDFEVERDSGLPMWGTLWAFGDSIDNDWLRGEFGQDGLQKMADCGFRIYQQEDYDYVFGIDGAGYDFYEAHWIPLYKARGLRWHKDADKEE